MHSWLAWWRFFLRRYDDGNHVLQGVLLRVSDHVQCAQPGRLRQDQRRSKESECIHIADDMALDADNISEMQKGMDVITQWADDNELKINLKKTELMVFKR